MVDIITNAHISSDLITTAHINNTVFDSIYGNNTFDVLFGMWCGVWGVDVVCARRACAVDSHLPTHTCTPTLPIHIHAHIHYTGVSGGAQSASPATTGGAARV